MGCQIVKGVMQNFWPKIILLNKIIVLFFCEVVSCQKAPKPDFQSLKSCPIFDEPPLCQFTKYNIFLSEYFGQKSI